MDQVLGLADFNMIGNRSSLVCKYYLIGNCIYNLINFEHFEFFWGEIMLSLILDEFSVNLDFRLALQNPMIEFYHFHLHSHPHTWHWNTNSSLYFVQTYKIMLKHVLECVTRELVATHCNCLNLGQRPQQIVISRLTTLSEIWALILNENGFISNENVLIKNENGFISNENVLI